MSSLPCSPASSGKKSLHAMLPTVPLLSEALLDCSSAGALLVVNKTKGRGGREWLSRYLPESCPEINNMKGQPARVGVEGMRRKERQWELLSLVYQKTSDNGHLLMLKASAPII